MNHNEFKIARQKYWDAAKVYSNSEKTSKDMANYVNEILNYTDAQAKHIAFLNNIVTGLTNLEERSDTN